MNFSNTEENYIKAIYHLQAETETVSTSALAARLHTKPASVTDMMKKLNGKKLLHYKRYHGFYLSAEGKRIALNIIRRHRLWEYFLSEKLKFGWNEVHPIAEELEHVSSKKLIDRLDEYLGFPQFDPHGDPIPDSKGKTKPVKKMAITQLPLHQEAEVTQVTNESKEMLELLQHKRICIGTRLEVKKHFPFDHSYEIKVKPSSIVTLSEQLAQNILVTYVQQGKQ